MALTATATRIAQNDILNQLRLLEPVRCIQYLQFTIYNTIQTDTLALAGGACREYLAWWGISVRP
jgi:superfamily II DNA helicase RecQ